MNYSTINTILNFWFPDENYHTWWFKPNNSLDNKININFYYLMKLQFDSFDIKKYQNESSEQIITRILLLDQFSRNINRVILGLNLNEYTSRAFELSKLWINKKYYLTEPINYTVFALLPIRHYANQTNNNQLVELLIDILDKIEHYKPTIKKNKCFQKFKFFTIKSLK
jgi:uncharacterized protein (DUF924 family)